MNIIQIALNLFYSLLFIEGIFFSCKFYSKKNRISKKFIYALFINVILVISLILYCSEKVSANVEIPIYLLSILFIPIGILSFYSKFLNLSLKKKNNFFLLFIMALFFVATLIPATDADSIRYHLGQFNDKSFNKVTYDLHEKISFIGDSLNLLSYQFKVYNLISILNFYSLFRLYKVLSSSINVNNKLAIFLLLFSCPILLSLLLTQKSYLFVVYSFCYLFFIIEKSSKDELNKMIYHVVLATALLGMMKVNFIYYSITVLVFLFFKKIKLIKYFKSIIFSSLFLLLFCSVNLYIYNDPFILFFNFYFIPENLDPDVIKFINFLLGKYDGSKTGLFNYVLFIFDLILPLKKVQGLAWDYLRYFTVSLGIGFFFLMVRINFSKFNGYFFIVLMFFLYNYYTNRLSIGLAHGRDYLIIYLLFILIIKDIFENKIILNQFFLKVLYVQLIVIMVAAVFFIASNLFFILEKTVYQYQYKNEDFLNERYNHDHTLVITHIDGNLFKKYNYINADMLNHGLDDYFQDIDLPNISKRFDVLTVLVKEPFWNNYWQYSKTFQKLRKYPKGDRLEIIMNVPGGRNPFNKKEHQIYYETSYYLNFYD